MENIRHILRPVVDLQKTGEKIKNLRKNNGFTVHELQELFGFEHPQSIYAWESGKCVPTVDNLLVLARLFSVSGLVTIRPVSVLPKISSVSPGS